MSDTKMHQKTIGIDSSSAGAFQTVETVIAVMGPVDGVRS